ncbi:hypothetical protein [Luteimonas aquatica]|uniref:hypothetical protein n=1 Tax=Luteimonas aquatica TaxID=450364 RepID=UPI001F573E45|nr:hypothetical protein [Luteimonas aquatica]
MLRTLRGGSGRPTLHISASHKSAPFFARFGALETARVPDGWGPGMHRVEMRLASDQDAPSLPPRGMTPTSNDGAPV